MRTDMNLQPQFEPVKDRDEEVLWVGQPDFTAFMIRGIPFLVLGLIWGAFDYFGFIRNMPKPIMASKVREKQDFDKGYR